MTARDIVRVKASFEASALRVVCLGFDVVEIHVAHGYLLHEFLSPLANRRQDEYGGSLANRMRFVLEIAEAVGNVLPPNVALGFRVTGTDRLHGGITIDEASALSSALKQRGVAYVCLSSGGMAIATIPITQDTKLTLLRR